MPTDIVLGIYFYFSPFIASYLIGVSFISFSHSWTEKIIFSYLLFVASIIVFILGLDMIPKGITQHNAFTISQAYFFISFLLFTLLKGREVLKIAKNRVFSIAKLNIGRFIISKINKNKLFLLIVIIFLLDIVASIWSIYLFPVNEGDSLAYHLQSAPNWYQAKNLVIYPTNDFRNMLFPDNQNFLVLWNFFSFKSDSLIEIIPYFYLLLSVLVIFDFLQKFQKNTFLNFLLSLLYYYVGTHFIYVKTFTGDIGVAALTLTSLTMLYSYIKYKNFTYFLFFSVSNGLLLGIKTPGLSSVIVLYIFALSYELFFGKLKKSLIQQKKSGVKLIGKYLFSLTICLTLGGFQYLRNLEYFHNPLYPKKIDILGLISLPGISDKLMGSHGFSPIRMAHTSWMLIKSLFQGALGYQFPLFYFPSILTLLLFFRKKISKTTYIVTFYLTVSSLVFLFTLAGAATRYFFNISFGGIILLANLIKVVDEKTQKVLAVLITIFILFSLLQTRTLFRFPELYNLSQKTPEERQLVNLYFDEDFYLYQKHIPNKTTILYLLPENSLIYPFYGPHYENRLIYANTDKTDEIINKIKEEKVSFIITKSEKSSYGSFFYKWDLQKGILIEFPETLVNNTLLELLSKGYIKEVASSARLTFYQINTIQK